MIDRAKITLPCLKLHPDAINDAEAYGVSSGLPLLSAGPHFSGKTKGHTAVVSPLADDVVRIMAKKEAGHWLSTSVEFNLGGLLHGHNGVPITTSAMLCAGLAELMSVLKLLLARPSDAARAIPGLPGSGAYWSSIEIPVNLIDHDRTLLSASRGITHPSIRKEPFTRKSSRKLQGTDLSVNTYSKDMELRKPCNNFDVCEELPRIYRLEFKVRRKKLKHYFGFAGKHLSNFSLVSLREVHLKIAREVRGFFALPRSSRKISSWARSIAMMVRNGRGSIEELIGDHLHANSRCRNSRSTLHKGVCAALEERSSITLEGLLSDQAYCYQPAVRIPKLEAATRQGWLRRGTEPGITQAYGRGELWPREFVPHVFADELNNDDYYTL